MREIKFRAWNKHHKRMYRVYSICFDTDTVGAQDIEKRTTHTFGFIDLDIQQFTGLKDKNGKDIYEGDIIKNQSGRTAMVNWHLFSGSWDAEPVYCGGDPEGLQTNLWRRYAEVIGNIHENPELME